MYISITLMFVITITVNMFPKALFIFLWHSIGDLHAFSHHNANTPIQFSPLFHVVKLGFTGAYVFFFFFFALKHRLWVKIGGSNKYP